MTPHKKVIQYYTYQQKKMALLNMSWVKYVVRLRQLIFLIKKTHKNPPLYSSEDRILKRP